MPSKVRPKDMRRVCRGCKRQKTIANKRSKLCLFCEADAIPKRQAKKALWARLAAAYDGLVDRFGEQCMICNRQPLTRRLNVDHSHRTQQIRGLLCFHCNYGLRWYGDDPVKLRAAAAYLEQFVQADT